MRFVTEDLMSKWGFRDGDILDDLLWDDGSGRYLLEGGAEHDLLFAVVRDHVVPALDQRVTLQRIHTVHNPVRAESVNGEEPDWYLDSPNPQITPEYVDVPDDVIRRLAERFAPIDTSATEGRRHALPE